MIELYTGEKILLLDLLQILKTYTDEAHRLTQHEILDILNKEYGITSKRKTVKNNIEKLIRYGERPDGNEILHSVKTRNLSSDTNDVTEVYTDFGYVHDFTHSELRFMIDSILLSKQIPSAQRAELIEKLTKLTSKHFNARMKHIRHVEENRPTTNNLFYTIEVIDEAINQGKKISFRYKKYAVNEQSELIEVSQQHQDGTPREYVINPYQMAVANGRYYLICNNDKYDNVSHYRLDRITDITMLDEKRKPVENVKGLEYGLHLPKHMTEHIYMFTGQSTSIQLRFKKSFLNEFVDWFGTTDVRFSDQTEDEVTARVTANEIAMRKWALQYGLHVKVLSPESLVTQIQEDIREVYKNYFPS